MRAFTYLAALPGLQVILILLAAATWLIGGNILVALHYRRRGKSAASGFRPFAFPFRDFDGKEWLMMIALAAASITLAAIAMSMNE